MNTEAVKKVHKFEQSGLGKAPFRFVGMVVRSGPIRFTDKSGITTEIGSPGQSMGCCKYCYTGIKYCFEIVSAEGNRFDVGSECVRHTFSDGSVVRTEVERALAQVKTTERHAREAERIAEGQSWAEEHRAELEAITVEMWEGRTQTLAEEFDWWMSHAGNRGKLKEIRHIKTRLAPV